MGYETNPITEADRDIMHGAKETVNWTDGRLHRITRLRLLTDVGFPWYDISYCYGLLRDCTPVRVSLPFSQLSKARWKSEVVRYAKRDNVNAKRLGIFDNVSTFS